MSSAQDGTVHFMMPLNERFDVRLINVGLQSLREMISMRVGTHLGVNNVFISFVKSYRQSVMTLRRLIAGRKLAPPYLMIGVTGISPDRTKLNIKAAMRSGIPIGERFHDGNHTQTEWMTMFHPIPMTLDVVLSYVDSDVARMVEFAAYANSGLLTNMFSHRLDFADFPQVEVVVNADAPSYQVGKDDWIDFDTEGQEGLQTVEVPARISGLFVGFRRKVAALRQDGIQIELTTVARGTITPNEL